MKSDYDVAVVGAGLAGLVAANRAAELGLSVICIEAGADGDYLCNSRMSMGIFHVAMCELTATPEKISEAVISSTAGATQAGLVAAISQNAGRSITWLAQNGARFVNGGRYSWMNRVLAPPAPLRSGLNWQGRGGDVTLRRLVERLASRGGDFVLGTRATSLLMKDGRVAGLVGVQGEGTREFRSAAVVLADGGFQGNMELVRRYISSKPELLCARNAGTGNGSGMLMAEAVGAKLVNLSSFYGHVQCKGARESTGLWPYPILDLLCAAGIVVDAEGTRFADEGLGGIYMANAIARHSDPDRTFVVFDDAIWNGTGTEYLVPPNPNAVQAGGQLVSGRTLEELAERIGCAPQALIAQVTDHNAFVAGNLPHLKPARTRPKTGASATAPQEISTSPFHAFQLTSGITYTMGGVATDAGGRVLDVDDHPIPGLYAAGSTTGGLEGGAIVGYTGGLSKALVFGLLAAEAAAEDVKARR